LKEIRVLIEFYFLCSQKKNKEEDFVNARVDDKCLGLLGNID
jgi:hypothetical protein